MRRRRFCLQSKGSRLGLDCRGRLGGHDCRSSILRIYNRVWMLDMIWMNVYLDECDEKLILNWIWI